MKTTMRIKVTQEHINKGIRCKPRHCPIALALLDAFKGKEDLLVVAGPYDLRVCFEETSGMWFWKKQTRKTLVISTPKTVQTFIRAFDTAILYNEVSGVKPFEFFADFVQS